MIFKTTVGEMMHFCTEKFFTKSEEYVTIVAGYVMWRNQ